MKDKNINDQFYFQIQREINRIESKANTFDAAFYSVRIAQILLAGFVTVISGIDENILRWESKDIILILGALITAITAADTLVQVEAKRNTYKLVLFELRTIRSEYVFMYIQNNNAVDPKNRMELFKKYKKANSYARDLIGTDSDKESDSKTNPQPDPAQTPDGEPPKVDP